MKSFYCLTYLTLLCSCSVLVGQVKPIEERSVNASSDSSGFHPDQWTRIGDTSAENSGALPDVAWQSNRTAAVISMNSVCRKTSGGERDLKKVTRVLLSQWDSLRIFKEQPVSLKGFPAYETTAKGRFGSRERKFQIVAIRSPSCIYDLIYLSPQETFDEELSVFNRFRDSLNLK